MRIEIFKFLVKQNTTDTVVAGFNNAADVAQYLKSAEPVQNNYNVIDQDFTGTSLECTAATFMEAYKETSPRTK